MRAIRYGLIILCLVLFIGELARADTDVNFNIGLPSVSIGIGVPSFPEFVPIPGFPVYYAPRIYANYFFYDGLYWVYVDDHWYSSFWYDGPWWMTDPDSVPLFLLRVPVFYYMRPPWYFHGWHLRQPPHWGDRWGHDWERRHHRWDRWDRHTAPPPAPLPHYQRHYFKDKYPRWEEQHELYERHYRYQPRDQTVREQLRKRLDRRGAPDVRREDEKRPRLRGAKERDPRLKQDEPRYSDPFEKRKPDDHQGTPARRTIEKRQRDEQPQRHGPDTGVQRPPARDSQQRPERAESAEKTRRERTLQRGESREPRRGDGGERRRERE